MRPIHLSLASLALLAASPALAGGQAQPLTDKDPDAVDVAKTPITDLNLSKQEIPPVLIAAVDAPYDLEGLKKCKELVVAVEELDGLLGPDIDLPQEERDRISAGRVAKWVVSSFIPFRGLIREVSGANDQQKKVQAAIQAGIARRGFLKGVGASRGCKYPARPAPRDVVEAKLEGMNVKDRRRWEKARARQAAREERRDERLAAAENGNSRIAYTSEPVVQALP